MYTVSVEATFSAVHQVRLPAGDLEPVHGHDWRLRAFFARPELDDCGMVVDFEAARIALENVSRELHHTDLGTHPGPAGRYQTAELVARFVFDQLASRGLRHLVRVEVTEAPGCVAAYAPDVARAHVEKTP